MLLLVHGQAGRRLAAVLSLALALVITVLACPAGSAPPAPDRIVTGTAVDSHSEVERVLGYWTKERMAKARPAKRLIRSLPRRQGEPVPALRKPARIAATQPSAEVGRVLVAKTAGGGFDWDGASDAPVTERTGKVFFTEDGIDYVCSGSAVSSENKDIVWTAGHCVHTGSEQGGFHSNWVFVPGRHDGVNPYGIWTARLLATTGRWAAYGDVAHDIGAAVMNTGGTEGLHLIEHVGGLAIGFSQPRNQRVYAFGFPAEAPYDGERLVYCNGDAYDDPYDQVGLSPHTQGVDCDMGNGASGGPWLADFDGSTGAVISVSAYVYPGKPSVFAPYQDDVARTLYDLVRDA